LNTPVLEKSPGKSPNWLRRDAIAGASVAVIAIPQAIAYALIAQVPAEYGVYTLVIHGILGYLLNHNPLMAIGPTNTQSLLVASVAMHVLGAEAGDDPAARGAAFLQIAITLSFLKGLIQIGLSGLRLGILSRYFSRSVVLGFTAGAGTLIALGQLPAFLGLESPVDYGRLPAAVVILGHVFGNAASISLPSVAVSMLTVGIVVACRLRNPLLPGALFALLATAVMCQATGWSGEIVACVDCAEARWPPVAIPDLGLRRVELLLGGAFALSVLGMVETYSISRSVTIDPTHTVRPDREMLAQGVIHVAGSFVGCIPGSGSFARSGMNVYAGAASRYSGLICALLVALTFLAAAPLIGYLPLPTLAGQIMVIAYSLSNWKGIVQIARTNRVDGIVTLFTFLATLLLPLHYAIFAGVLVNLGIYLRSVSRLNILELVRTEGDAFTERVLESPADLPSRDTLVIQLQGDLFFGMEDELSSYLDRIALLNPKVVVIRLKATRSIDTTVMGRLVDFVKRIQSRGGYVLCCGVASSLKKKMATYGLLAIIKPENVFDSAATVFESSHAALSRAAALQGIRESPTGSED
jgi:SulP family sulfate permease